MSNDLARRSGQYTTGRLADPVISHSSPITSCGLLGGGERVFHNCFFKMVLCVIGLPLILFSKII